MTTWYTDADLVGAVLVQESEVWIATEFTIDGGIATPRWRWPTVNPSVTPLIRIFNALGQIVGDPLPFTSSALNAWNSTAGVLLGAGTFRFTVNTTHYMARGGFFAGGPITRGTITAIQSRFGSPGAAPPTAWPAAYFIDIDLAPPPASGITPRPVGGITSRFGFGITTRPNSGITPRP